MDMSMPTTETLMKWAEGLFLTLGAVWGFMLKERRIFNARVDARINEKFNVTLSNISVRLDSISEKQNTLSSKFEAFESRVDTRIDVLEEAIQYVSVDV